MGMSQAETFGMQKALLEREISKVEGAANQQVILLSFIAINIISANDELIRIRKAVEKWEP